LPKPLTKLTISDGPERKTAVTLATVILTAKFIRPIAVATVLTSQTASADSDVADLLGYSTCTIRLADKLDDGKIDVADLAHILADCCENEYSAWKKFMLRRSHTSLPSNLDLATSTIVAERNFRSRSSR